ncbi:hypothetical protein DFP73DRAFT_562060 [Morchella snyderi]|nr:hypothetical protein DFP73DRAFT_562060 [Morchella snyderi]
MNYPLLWCCRALFFPCSFSVVAIAMRHTSRPDIVLVENVKFFFFFISSAFVSRYNDRMQLKTMA